MPSVLSQATIKINLRGLMLSSFCRKRVFTQLQRNGTLNRFQRFSSTETFPEAYKSVFGSDGEPQIAFLGTGPMALSLAANILKTVENNGLTIPKVVLLTEQEKYYNALKSKGFKVIDERDGSVYLVDPNQLVVVKSVEEFEQTTTAAPKLIFGTMQMGQKTDRWGIVDIAKERLGGDVTVLTAANGIPFTTMLDKVMTLPIISLRGWHINIGADLIFSYLLPFKYCPCSQNNVYYDTDTHH